MEEEKVEEIEYVICSCCGEKSDSYYKYCEHCGVEKFPNHSIKVNGGE